MANGTTSGILYGPTVNHFRAYAKWTRTETDTQIKCGWTTGMQSVGWGFNIHGVDADAWINSGHNFVSNQSFYSATSATVSKDLVSYSTTINRGKSTYTVGAACTVTNHSGYMNGSSRIDSYFTIPALASYSISYNANGGSGAPATQTKWYNENLTLSNTKPTRTGYTFVNWSTNFGSGSVYFNPGSTYTRNSGTTLYANWKANTWTVSYNANGGSGAPAAQTKTYGQTLTLSTTRPTRTNYNFLGWSTSSVATSATYQPGGSYTANSGATLYAVWKLAYVAPRITNLSADRCDSAGTLSEEGTYARVTFSWATDKAVSAIRIVCNGVTTNISGSGTSGSVSRVVGAGSLNTENSYTINVTVADTMGSSTSNQVVPPLAYIIDFSPQGGVGIGKPAPNKKAFEIHTPLTIQNRQEGFFGRGNTGNPNTWSWKPLIKTDYPINDDRVGGAITIRGVLGGYGARNNGSIDVSVGTREVSSTEVIVDKFGPALFNNRYARLRVIVDSSKYLTVYIAAAGYYYYNLFIEAIHLTRIIDSDWTTTEPRGTILFDSATVKTDQFGGYPAKFEKLNNYYGLALPDKSRTGLVRSTYNGFIPYQAGTPSPSVLGTSMWIWKETWTNALNWSGNGLKGRVSKLLWSGTLSVGGSITVSELSYYNLFAFVLGGSAGQGDSIVTAFKSGSSIIASSFSYAGSVWMQSFAATISGTKLTYHRGNVVPLNNGASQSGTSYLYKVYGIL